MNARLAIALVLTLGSLRTYAAADIDRIPSHPRIILRTDDMARLKETLRNDAPLQVCQEFVEEYVEKELTAPVSERIKTGRRLLTISRRVERRVIACSYLYLLTNDRRYAERAEREMMAAASFTDWNPSHFLDVAEMTAALAIGYDWLYDVLSPESRSTIASAIVEKGLRATDNERYLKFYRQKHNWNQVCNAGLTMGAVAVYDLYPELARGQIERSIESNRIAMGCYGPDGVYPEGYSYWGYGTWYEVLLIETLRSFLGQSHGLEKAPGFLESAVFMDYMVSPSGQAYNFSDCGRARGMSNPLLYWFAGEKGDTSILWADRERLLASSKPRFMDDRMLPLAMIFASRIPLGEVRAPACGTWIGDGVQPVYIYNERGTQGHGVFLGVKGGSASINHAHMDAGSFVYERDGVRWASDPGSQGYHSLESRKVDLWNKRQDSQRWEVFRIGASAHNTLTVNGARHVVSGNARMTSTTDDATSHGATVDLTPVLGSVAHAERTVSVDASGFLSVNDVVEASSEPCTVKWTMWTEAEAEIVDSRTVRLTRDSKTMTLRFRTSSKAVVSIEENVPPHDYDEPNPGTRRVCLSMKLRPGKRGTISVTCAGDAPRH